MRIVSYNIQYGRGVDDRYDLARTCERLRGADIACLQEVEQFWQRSGDVDQPAEIARLLPDYYVVYGSSFDVDASRKTADGRVDNRRRRHGNLILSRWPILSSRSFDLPKLHYPDKFNMHMTCVEAVISIGPRTVGPHTVGPRALRVYSYHAGYLESSERLSQVADFAARFGRAPDEGGAWSGKTDIDGFEWGNGEAAPPMPTSAIVCGDFNSNPQSPEFGLLLELTGLVDCWAVAAADDVNSPTLHREGGEDVRVWGKIDHILVTPDLAGAIANVSIDHDCEASDHKPIELVLDLD